MDTGLGGCDDQKVPLGRTFSVNPQENMKNRSRLVLGILLGLTVLKALGHGDVTPHPVDTATLPQLGAAWVDTNPFRGNEKAVAVGAEGYKHNCAGCHGLEAQSGGMAPDLLVPVKDCMELVSGEQQSNCLKENDDFFKSITLKGKRNGEGRYVMPAYDGVFTQEAVWAVKSYIDSRAIEDNARKSK
jgi:cytochrome c-550 PedF